MGGVLGLGSSSAKTDRATQLAAQQGGWNIFSQGLGFGTSTEGTGTADLTAAKSTLGGPEQYWNSLLTAGRTQTAQNAAPAINTALAGADAARKQEGAFGTSRVGGTAAANREAGSKTQGSIDDIVSNTLMTGRTAGAQGLERVSGAQAAIGQTELSTALASLGLSADTIKSIMSNATDSRKTSFDINSATQEQWGELMGFLAT